VPKKQHLVRLTPTDREQLESLVREGIAPARAVIHALALLSADIGPGGSANTDRVIAAELHVSRPTIERVRKRFAQEGLAAALDRRATDRQYRTKLNPQQAAELIALSSTPPPPDQPRWTLRLLANAMVTLGYVESISYETIRRILKKAPPSVD